MATDYSQFLNDFSGMSSPKSPFLPPTNADKEAYIQQKLDEGIDAATAEQMWNDSQASTAAPTATDPTLATTPVDAKSLTREEYVRLKNEQGYDPTTAGQDWDELQATSDSTPKGSLFDIPFINPYGTNIETELYMAGQAIGMTPGSRGRGAAIAGGIGSAVLGGARTLLSGLGNAQQNQAGRQYYEDRLGQNRYTPNSQYQNTNNVGGVATGAFGGLFGEDGFDYGDPVKVRQRDQQEAVVGATSVDLSTSTLVTDPVLIKQYEQEYQTSLNGGRLYANNQGGYYVTGGGNPPPTAASSNNYVGEYTVTLNGMGAPGVNNPNAIQQVKIPYNSQEEYNRLRKDAVGLKSYADYMNSPYYRKFATGGLFEEYSAPQQSGFNYSQTQSTTDPVVISARLNMSPTDVQGFKMYTDAAGNQIVLDEYNQIINTFQNS